MKIDHLQEISIDDVVKVAVEGERIEFTETAIRLIHESNGRVNKIVEQGQPVYGINTGFGIFANKTIDKVSIEKLNRNLILSHSVATGKPLDGSLVRAAMFIRAVTLAKGFSGLRPEIINTIVEMLNRGVTPLIPQKGSLGSSGDLCQLSHMALVFSKDEQDLESESGQAIYKGHLLSGKKAMEEAGIERIILQAKEGLAINNGATFSAAIAALSVYEAEYLIHVAEIATALSMEALCARSNVLDKRIHVARRQKGQIYIGDQLTKLTQNSTLLDSKNQVQDAYSIRCAPQVIGAILDTVNYVKSIVEREINAVTDNPLIFETGEAISGGNFHGEPVGLVMDYLSIAMCELGAISERRVFRLTDEKLNNGLPPMLVSDMESAGLNSGMMLPQYTAASLVLENQTLASPDSIRSLPTSANQEDHNSNAMTAARHVYEIIENLRQILSIEIYAALRGLEIRLQNSEGQPGEGTAKIAEMLRNEINFVKEDTIWGIEINKIYRLLEEHKF